MLPVHFFIVKNNFSLIREEVLLYSYKFVSPLMGDKFQFTVYTTSSSAISFLLNKLDTSADKNHS